MKEAELRAASTCARCGKKIGDSGLPLFWRVKVERFGVDMRAVERQTGSAMVLGHAGIAAIMGPDEDMAKPIMDPVIVTICEPCGTQDTCVAMLAGFE